MESGKVKGGKGGYLMPDRALRAPDCSDDGKKIDR